MMNRKPYKDAGEVYSWPALAAYKSEARMSTVAVPIGWYPTLKKLVSKANPDLVLFCEVFDE